MKLLVVLVVCLVLGVCAKPRRKSSGVAISSAKPARSSSESVSDDEITVIVKGSDGMSDDQVDQIVENEKEQYDPDDSNAVAAQKFAQIVADVMQDEATAIADKSSIPDQPYNRFFIYLQVKDNQGGRFLRAWN